MTDLIPAFATEQEAADWMWQRLENEECIDGYRFAFADDETAVSKYEARKDDGCCGFFDVDVIVAGRPAVIGCNYGH